MEGYQSPSTLRTMRITVLRWLKSAVLMLFVLFCLAYSFFGGRYTGIYPFIEKTDIAKFLAPVLHPYNAKMPLCPLIVNSTRQQPFDAESITPTYNASGISRGGGWRPAHCLSQHKIAIIVPYRRREEHLEAFMSYIHGFLQTQLIDYQIYVVEQSEKYPFNRALLFNIGYTEVLKRQQVPCFIFHDVDLLPENIENVYGCTIEPRHMSSSVNTLGYELPYETIFGGAVSFLQVQFQATNGFSNKYFGWGREDDDMYFRTVNRGMKIVRFEPKVSRYYMLSHIEEATLAPKNLVLLYNALDNQDSDGLNNVERKYNVLKIEEKPLYTLVKVDLRNPND